MVLMAGFEIPAKAIREQIASSLNVVIQVARLSDGHRRVVKVTEVTGMEGDVITLQDIYLYEKMGVDPNGTVLGRFRATGVRPKFADTMAVAGIQISPDMFSNRKI